MGFRLVVVVSAFVVMAGCTSSPAEKDDPKPSAAPAPAVTIDPAKASVLKPGDDLPVVEDLPPTIGNDVARFSGFASADALIGDLARPDKSDDKVGTVTTQSHPMLYNLTSRSVIRMDDGLVRPRKTQVLGMASVDASVVWVESAQAFVADGDIALYTYERTSGLRLPMTEDPAPPADLFYGEDLTAVDGRIYFSMASIGQKVGKGAAIYSGPADGSGSLTILVKDGQKLTIAGHKMTYFVGKKQFVRDLDSGDTQPARVSSRAKADTFCGAEFASTYETVCQGSAAGETGVDNAVLTIKDKSGHVTKVGPFSGESPRAVRRIGPWLAFSAADDQGEATQYLFQLQKRTLATLPKGDVFGPTLGGRLALVNIPTAGSGQRQTLVRLPSS